MRIILSGCMGHMGMAVTTLAYEKNVEIAYGVDIAPGKMSYPVYSSFDELPQKGDVIIDFSRPSCLDGMLAFAIQHSVPAVICTTGYSEEETEKICKASDIIPVFHSGNMSLGIALISALSKKAAEILGDNFDCEIIEAHHNRKVDAPSGTAKMLFESVRSAYPDSRDAVMGRSGSDCKRTHSEIGIHSLRGGTVTGEHQVCFFGPSERITISHSAENRSVFASGALKAAEFISGAVPGLYDMSDIVGKI